MSINHGKTVIGAILTPFAEKKIEDQVEVSVN